MNLHVLVTILSIWLLIVFVKLAFDFTADYIDALADARERTKAKNEPDPWADVPMQVIQPPQKNPKARGTHRKTS